MKKILLLLSLLAFLSLVLVSCSDDDDDKGGFASDLFGKWRVEKIYDEGEWINIDDLYMEVFFVLNNDFTYTFYDLELDNEKTLDIESGDSEIESGTYSVKGKILHTYPEEISTGDLDDAEESQYSCSLKGDKLTLTYYDEDGEDEDFKLNLKRYSDDDFNLALEKIKICGAWGFYGEDSDEYVFFMPDGTFLMATTVKDWSWGKNPLPVRKFGKWQFSDGKLLVTFSKDTTVMTYEIDEHWLELTLKSSGTEKTYDRETTSIYDYFNWI